MNNLYKLYNHRNNFSLRTTRDYISAVYPRVRKFSVNVNLRLEYLRFSSPRGSLEHLLRIYRLSTLDFSP